VPALLPPIAVDGRHYVDGGIVNSIPVGRAGRIDRPLSAPRHMLDVAKVAFEISRRRRFALSRTIRRSRTVTSPPPRAASTARTRHRRATSARCWDDGASEVRPAPAPLPVHVTRPCHRIRAP
jgi:predicted acylesterase/phospholipase RssA